jgi:hypothetical protein
MRPTARPSRRARKRQRRRHPRRGDRAAEDHRHDAEACGAADVEPCLACAAEEQGGIRLQARHTPGFDPQDAQRFQRRGGQRRRKADRVDEARRRVAQQVHQRVLARHITATGGERLRQRAHPDVDARGVHAATLGHATAGRTQHA